MHLSRVQCYSNSTFHNVVIWDFTSAGKREIPLRVALGTQKSVSLNWDSCISSQHVIGQPRVVEAVELYRKLRGGSQSLLARGSDGRLYVLKMAGNPQGRTVLANEALASMLCRRLGLPVADWAYVRISDELLDANPHLWWELPEGSVRPKAGLAFGSVVIHQEDGTPANEILPSSWVGRLSNREDFAGMLFFDLWTGARDARQAVFLSSEGSRAVRAVFIDHGHCFGGPDGELKDETCWARAMHLHKPVYEGLFQQRRFNAWKQAIQNITTEEIHAFLGQIPQEWLTQNWQERVCSFLENRRFKLKEEFSAAKAYVFTKKKPAAHALNPANDVLLSLSRCANLPRSFAG